MTKHYPRSHSRHKQEQGQQKQPQHQKDRGWYCKQHETKYLCDICGYENKHNKQRSEVKYYFVSGWDNKKVLISTFLT